MTDQEKPQPETAVFAGVRFPVADDWPSMPEELDRPWMEKAHRLKRRPKNAA